ncbi:MAG TPA: phosphopantetheine-binding protein [Hymenobacter sp.]|jgi:acyl carrier protein
MFTHSTSHTATSIERLVLHTISKRKSITMKRLQTTTDLAQELGFDTLDVVDIILELERRFQVNIPDEVPLATVNDFVRYLDTHLSPRHMQAA